MCTWNALVVLGFFELHLAAPQKGYMEKAVELLSAMRKHLLEDGMVLHEFGGDQGFLDDHATFGFALLKGYALTGDEEYIVDAKNIAAMIGERFSLKKRVTSTCMLLEEIRHGKRSSKLKTMSYLVQILIPLSSFMSLAAMLGNAYLDRSQYSNDGIYTREGF